MSALAGLCPEVVQLRHMVVWGNAHTTACLHCREMGATHHEGHLGPCQRRSERATNSAGTDHCNQHRFASALMLRKGWHSSITFSKLKVSRLIGAARCSSDAASGFRAVSKLVSTPLLAASAAPSITVTVCEGEGMHSCTKRLMHRSKR